MKRQFFALLILLVFAISAAAQNKSTYTPPKTPWGDPDLQGQWPAVANIPMQRPANFGTRAFLTDEELTQRERQAERQQEADSQVKSTGAQSVTINPPSYWQERQKPNRQASLVVDPPNGRIPPMTPDGQKFVQSLRGASDPASIFRTKSIHGKTSISTAAVSLVASSPANYPRFTTSEIRSCRDPATSRSGMR